MAGAYSLLYLNDICIAERRLKFPGEAGQWGWESSNDMPSALKQRDRTFLKHVV